MQCKWIRVVGFRNHTINGNDTNLFFLLALKKPPISVSQYESNQAISHLPTGQPLTGMKYYS